MGVFISVILMIVLRNQSKMGTIIYYGEEITFWKCIVQNILIVIKTIGFWEMVEEVKVLSLQT